MRKTAGSATIELVAGPLRRPPAGGRATDTESLSFVIFSPADPPAGVVLLKPAAAGTTPGDVDMSDAARWNFGLVWLNYVCEPGRALFCQRGAGVDVPLDVLEGGER